MKLKHKISGYIIRSAAIAVLFSCAVVGFTSAFNLPGKWSRSLASTNAVAHAKMLTFADRVAYQRAIEGVYWRHRIWPSERCDPKPSLDAVMSQAQIEKKVEDYLRDSQLLEDHWQRPITPEQLQAEMERMAHHTKQPQVLREIFQALGDDPFIIAECLARPVLTQRLIAQLRNADHVSLTNVAWSPTTVQSRLAGVETLVSTKLPAIDSISEAVQVNRPYQFPAISSPSGGCIDNWNTTSTTNSPAARSSHTAVWTGSEMIVWGGYNGSSDLNTGGRYNPSTDSWMATGTANAPSARVGHTAVWTGSEMIVWGGHNSGSQLNTGGRYNPTTDSWTATSTANAPDARSSHTAVWTGSEMIVWGGANASSYFNTGGRYDPGTDSWTATNTINAPPPRASHTAVWTGSEMIVWGGGFCSPCIDFNTGGKYDPGTDTWLATSTSKAPDARFDHAAVWTGSQMIVWGGVAFPDTLFNTGGRYTPDADSWTPISTTNAPSAREVDNKAVWTGTEMIVWGGSDFNGQLNTGGRYNAAMDSWTATSITNAPTARSGHTAVWTSSEMIVWGGASSGSYFNTGGRYCAQSGATPTPTVTATATPTATATATLTPTASPRITPTPRSRPTPAPRP